MTRKDFTALVEEVRDIQDQHIRNVAALAVAAACKRLNSGFNLDRFLGACGYDVIDETPKRKPKPKVE
jgi:hypothetical protein